MVVAGMVIYAYLLKWRKYYLYLIPVIIGIFRRTGSYVCTIIVLLYYVFWKKNLSARDLFMPNNFIQGIKVSLAAFVACFFFISLVMKMVSVQPWSLYGTSRFHYLITQPFVILYYFVTFFFPFNLSADTDWKAITYVFDFRVIVGTLFILTMLIVAYRTSKRKETRPVSFGIVWFFLALAPSSSFVPLAEVMNDHRMFFPFIGLMLSVCWALGLCIIKYEKSIKANYLQRTAIIIIALGILADTPTQTTHQRNKVWHTGESLWYDVTIKSPGNGRGLMNYGLTQMEKGNYRKALEYFEKKRSPSRLIMLTCMSILVF